ncbi:uncharacterized protein LOC105281508 isoform X2 [Ooceraea biroi]|uniref:uncharacterized protein LOC105281508 isoform X2 n=1 Tax=Ooceraea biroi TaxID=2015173 RepID=UPI0005BC5CF4|nr:uncharacterized protein LOC105281508 isoform X2 [Ooceraea biroi]
MERKETAQLHKLKEELLKKVILLRNKLKDQEESGRQLPINFNIAPSSNDEDHKLSESLSTKYKTKLCEISSQLTGITFQNVNKRWLHDNVYVYVAKVKTKTISFNLELTIVFKDFSDFSIDDIRCYFIDVDDCYMIEISPWFEKIISMKNFSLLMSALSNYNENNILRSKILRNLEGNKYANVEPYTQDTGGILVYVHPSGDTAKNYLIFQWTMKFLELTWHIEHFFTVKSTDIGVRFSEENYSLLKEFCKVGLTRDSLVELWNRLCTAVDAYHAKNTKNM